MDSGGARYDRIPEKSFMDELKRRRMTSVCIGLMNIFAESERNES
jgi:hypothetical protein